MAREQNFAADGISVIFMLLPLLYFGGLIYYFSGVGGGTLQGIADIGLGPTILGLSVLGLLFAIKPLMMLVRLLAGMGGGRPQAVATARGSAIGDEQDMPASGFDADDAIARYLARRDTPAATDDQSVPSAPLSPPPMAPRPSFGRKTL